MWQLRIRDYAGLIAAFKIRREELGWSQEETNARLGWQEGYYSKIETPNNKSGRSLTPVTFGEALEVLGLELIATKRSEMSDPRVCLLLNKTTRWKRHKSKRLLREEKRSRDRAYRAVHRRERRVADIERYWRQKKLRNPTTEKRRNLDTKVKFSSQTPELKLKRQNGSARPSIRSRSANPKPDVQDRSSDKPSDIAARL